MFRSVDRAVLVATFGDRLRNAGIDVGLSAANRFSEALSCCSPRDTATLYWTARTCLLNDRADIAAFDDVFGAIFGNGDLPVAPAPRESPRVAIKASGTVMVRSESADSMTGRVEQVGRAVIVDGGSDSDEQSDPKALPELLPSAIAELADTPFDQLDNTELDRLGQWLQEVAPHLLVRKSRRYRSTARGRAVDIRRTIQLARSTGGETIRLVLREPRTRPRKIVMVADLSGSMQAFSRIYLHLMRSLVVNASAEVFAFSTSLRRVTVSLGERDSQRAIDRLADVVDDRFGGTRIAASLGELIASPVWSNALRRAVVVIVSDGWDADAPAELERRMQRLSRMAHRVIWVNPRMAAADFEPLVGAMAAALPHTDATFSGHTLNTMRDVIAALGPASLEPARTGRLLGSTRAR